MTDAATFLAGALVLDAFGLYDPAQNRCFACDEVVAWRVPPGRRATCEACCLKIGVGTDNEGHYFADGTTSMPAGRCIHCGARKP